MPSDERPAAWAWVRKYTWAMILSFGPDAAALSPAAFALALPSVVALACYVAAAMPGERFSAGLRRALLVGWIAQGLSIVIDVTGIGSNVAGIRFGFAPALSITLWTVLAVYELESQFVPLPGARRALASCGVVVVVLAWIFPGQVHPQAASVWAPLHWLLGIASYALFGVAVLHALLLSRAERQMRRDAEQPMQRRPHRCGLRMHLAREDPGQHDHDDAAGRERPARAGQGNELALELVDREHRPERDRQGRRKAETDAGDIRADAGDVDDDRQALGDPADQQSPAQARRKTLARHCCRDVAGQRDDARQRQCERGRREGRRVG